MDARVRIGATVAGTRTIVTVAFVLAGLLVASGAQAQVGPFYVDFSTGLSIYDDQDTIGDGYDGSTDFLPGYVVGGAAGFRFMDNFRFEITGNYRDSEVGRTDTTQGSLQGSGHLQFGTVMGNVVLEVGRDWGVIPFLGIGLGVAVMDVDVRIRQGTGYFKVDDDSVVFAWNIMGGISVPVGDDFEITTGVRFVQTDDTEFDMTTSPNTLVPGGRSDFKTELSSVEATMGLRYKF